MKDSGIIEVVRPAVFDPVGGLLAGAVVERRFTFEEAWRRSWRHIHREAAMAAQRRLANERMPHMGPLEQDRRVAMECWSALIGRGHVDA